MRQQMKAGLNRQKIAAAPESMTYLTVSFDAMIFAACKSRFPELQYRRHKADNFLRNAR